MFDKMYNTIYKPNADLSNSVNSLSHNYKGRTDYLKEINGSQELEYLKKYPNLIGSIKLVDGEILKLKTPDVFIGSDNSSMIGINCEEGYLTINAKDIKRITFKYPWAFKYIGMVEQEGISEEYFKKLDKVVYFKTLDEFGIIFEGYDKIYPISCVDIILEKLEYSPLCMLLFKLNKLDLYLGKVDIHALNVDTVLKTPEGMLYAFDGDEGFYSNQRHICEFIYENHKELIEVFE